MAHKKAAGSAKNLRDSQPKFRGVKIFGGQKTTAGNIIVRQCGNKYEAGTNTYLSNDYSIHAKIDGVVRFSKTNKVRFDGRKYLKTVVNVDPCKEIAEKAPKAKKETSATKVEKTTKVEKIVEEKAPKAEKAPKTEKKPTTKKTTVKKTTK